MLRVAMVLGWLDCQHNAPAMLITLSISPCKGSDLSFILGSERLSPSTGFERSEGTAGGGALRSGLRALVVIVSLVVT